MGAFTLIEGDVVLHDSSGNVIAVLDDSGTYRLQVFAKVVGKDAEAVAPSDNPLRVAGWDGTNLRTLKTDALGRLIVSPKVVGTAVRGLSHGWATLAALTVVPIRQTTYNEVTSNAQRSIVSSQAADSSAGTGVRTVRITYYTATFTGPFTETITMNGTTPVNTSASDICYIEKMEAMTVGSGLDTAGIISLKTGTGGGGATIWSIATDAIATHGAHHYVATGKTCYITSLTAGIKGANTTGVILRAQYLSVSNSPEFILTEYVRTPTGGSFQRTYDIPIEVVGPARITAHAVPDSATSYIYYASFDYLEE